MGKYIKFVEESEEQKHIQRLLKLCRDDNIGCHYEEGQHLFFLGCGYGCCFSACTQIILKDGHPVIEFGSDMNYLYRQVTINLDDTDDSILILLRCMDMECVQLKPDGYEVEENEFAGYKYGYEY